MLPMLEAIQFMAVLSLSNSKRRREAEVNEMECRTKAGTRAIRTESETAQQFYNSELFNYFPLSVFPDSRLIILLYYVSLKGCLPQKNNFKEDIQLYFLACHTLHCSSFEVLFNDC